MEEFDFAVIGGGTAGSAAALQVASAGYSVAVIEATAIGGDAVWFSDLPSEAVFYASRAFVKAKSQVAMGLNSATLSLNYPVMQKWKNGLRRTIASAVSNDYKHAGIEIIKGFGTFIDSHVLKIGSRQIFAKKILIATGSEISLPDIQGVDKTPFLTPSDVLNLPKLPKSVLIVGGGATGTELAGYMASLGSKVTIAELGPNLLPREDDEVGTFFKNYFTRRLNIRLLLGTRVEAIANDKISSKAMLLTGGNETTERFEAIVLATGRSSNISVLNLKAAGIHFDDNGIAVTPTLQTNRKHIFAAGDCISPENDGFAPQNSATGYCVRSDSSPQKAVLQGQIAASNAFPKTSPNGRKKTSANYTGLPRITRTPPMIATVGMTENEAIRQDVPIKKAVILLNQSSAFAIDGAEGFIKIITDRGKKLLGACIVAPHADQLMTPISLALQNDLPLASLASLQTSFLNYSDLIPNITSKLL
ncbi:NAD(P)/FAD-dependent oxidoreductase [Candidatus Saccharibacteria bacterium]|nr:NAD(P)/FAD-dependent oxidoreductase [Candidatus Saccharibacteria bacterium]